MLGLISCPKSVQASVGKVSMKGLINYLLLAHLVQLCK